MNGPLDTWIGLNDELRSADEERCKDLMRRERGAACRLRFLVRIHSRLNKLRAARERAELIVLCGRNK